MMTLLGDRGQLKTVSILSAYETVLWICSLIFPVCQWIVSTDWSSKSNQWFSLGSPRPPPLSGLGTMPCSCGGCATAISSWDLYICGYAENTRRIHPACNVSRLRGITPKPQEFNNLQSFGFPLLIYLRSGADTCRLIIWESSSERRLNTEGFQVSLWALPCQKS